MPSPELWSSGCGAWRRPEPEGCLRVLEPSPPPSCERGCGSVTSASEWLFPALGHLLPAGLVACILVSDSWSDPKCCDIYTNLTFPQSHGERAENIQVTLPLEGRLVGKVGFKTYKNYFIAGAHQFIIIFLILVNIAAQVNMDIYFGLCPQLGIYILFMLYLFNLY